MSYKSYLQSSQNQSEGTEVKATTWELITKEIENFERAWVKEIQKSLDHTQLKELNRTLASFKHEEGIVRCKGRLINADLPDATKFPALIPPGQLTTLIIRDCRKGIMHIGVKDTLSQLRTRFWLVIWETDTEEGDTKMQYLKTLWRTTLPGTSNSTVTRI